MAGGDPPRRTLAGPGAAMIEARRSKFFAYACPLPEEPEALRVWLAEIRARHHDARHVVYGWRGPGGQMRGSDDGEPHGTGARPCQDALVRADVRLAAVAVARIFGGVLLGAGNLGRVYADAARAAVADAGVRVLDAHLEIRVRVGFGDVAPAERLLRSAGVVELGWGADAAGIEGTGWVAADRAAALVRDLAEATSGRAEVTVGQVPRWRSPG